MGFSSTFSPCAIYGLAIAVLPLAAASGTPLASALAACRKITSGGVETQTWPLGLVESDYLEAKAHYWSAANADSTPACVVFPTSAQDVSEIVSILLNYANVDFAVKSGGHNPNVGYSSVDGGVLISMKNLSSTRLSADTRTAEIGPGSRWSGVVEALVPHGVTVVGGRLGDVGVGGYLLGGGLSFMSTEYGLACDGIINYEVVLANASVVNANATNNQDLFWALKGGGNQFGIVTKFTMETHPIGQVWGGIRTYLGTEASALLNATHDLTSNYHDPKAAVIVTGEIAIDSLLEIFVVFFYYNGPTPPAGVFDKFDAIPHITDSTSTQSYDDLLNGNDATNLYGLRYLIRAGTLPNLADNNGLDLYNYHYNTWKSYVMTQGINHPGFIFSLAFQPMPYLIPAASQAAGGNALAMDPAWGDRMWMEYDISWLTALGDDDAHAMAMNITETIEAYAKATYAGVPNTHYIEGDVMYEEYNPIFLNDAMYDQKPLQSYGNASYDRLKEIQVQVDPEGFFPNRTGGFKFS